MEKQAGISANKLKQNIGKTRDVIIDTVGDEQLIGRSSSDAPDIDGLVYIDAPCDADVEVGDIVQAKITYTDEYDMCAELIE